MKLLGMFVLYTILFAGLAITVCRQECKKYYTAAKTMNSMGFLGVLLAVTVISGEIHQFWLMLPAFLCCFAGDVLLAFYNGGRRRIHFLMGLGVFLVGHICFVRWLCEKQPLSWKDLLFPFAGVLIAWGLTMLRGMHTGRLKPFILVYAFFVCMLFSKGVHVLLAAPSVANAIIAFGGTLFLISDISILFLYFYKTHGAAVHLFNLATYYFGMFFLEINLLFLA